MKNRFIPVAAAFSIAAMLVPASSLLAASLGFSVSPGIVTLAAPYRSDTVYDNFTHTLYISAGSSVLRYDTNTNTFLDPWNIGGNLVAMDLSPDHSTLAIADLTYSTQNRVHLVDTATGQDSPVSFNLAYSEAGTCSVAYDSYGKLLVTSGYNGSGWVPLRKYDPVTQTTTVIAQPRQSSVLVASADRSTIALAEGNISSGPIDIYRAGTSTLEPYTGTNRALYTVAVNRDGTQFAAPSNAGTSIFNYPSTESATALGIDGTDSAAGVVYSPNSDVLYVSWVKWIDKTDEIRAYSTTTFQLLQTWHVGSSFDFGGIVGQLNISPDGSLLFVNIADGGIAIIPVPEPTTIGLLGIGGFMLAFRRRRF